MSPAYTVVDLRRVCQDLTDEEVELLLQIVVDHFEATTESPRLHTLTASLLNAMAYVVGARRAELLDLEDPT